MLRFNPVYFILTFLLLLVEILIAVYVHDNFVRPYIGDLLVVILLYSFVMCFLKVNKWKVAIAVFVFACMVEFLQYLNIVTVLGLAESKLARIIIGTSFAWEDIIAYATGILIVAFFEFIAIQRYITKR